MRKAGEARRSMTKFMSTIAIAVFLELLVAVFAAGKDDVSNMIYPTFLLLSGVALVVGLGVYQRLSVEVEMDEGPDPGGVWLAALGGSLFFLLLGLLIAASGGLLLWRRPAGLILYALAVLATLGWAVSRSGPTGGRFRHAAAC